MTRSLHVASLLAVICFAITVSTDTLASARPDPDLVAAMESAPTSRVHPASWRAPAQEQDLVYPDGTLPTEPTNATQPSPLTAGGTLKYGYKPSFREKHFSFIVPSVVVHGFAIDKDVADQMPHKLDGGQTVVTPGAGLQYVSPGGFLVIGGILKDCYDNLAGLFQVGQQFKLGSHTTFGYSVGVYARETPTSCTTTTNRFGRTSTTCDEFDNYQIKFLTKVNGESVDIIPMPFLHFTTALIRTDFVEIDFKIMSNFALNEFGFSVPF